MIFLARESEGPSILNALLHFLFGTFIGWWILIVLFLALSAPVMLRVRLWQRRRAFLRNEASKLANPQNADARYQLAVIYYDGRRNAKARALIEEAIGIAAESPLYDEVPHRFHVLLGNLHYRKGRHADALSSYQKSLSVKSDLGYGDVYLCLGRCTLRRGDAEAALEWLKKSRQERTSYLETYFRIAQAAAVLGREEEVKKAKADFRETAKTLPRFARQKKLWWKLAFGMFPITRRLL